MNFTFDDNDPNNIDMNHFSSLYHNLNSECQSSYYTCDEFNEQFAQSSNDFKIMHLNICSLYPKVDIFTAFLSSLKCSFDVLCLTETWLNSSTVNLVEFPKYNMFNLIREDGRRGGGVGILVDRKYNTKQVDNLSFSNDSLECLFVEITHGCNRILIGSIYRPPSGDVTRYFESLENLMSSIVHRNYRSIIISGDFNLDLLNSDNDNNCSNFSNIMFCNSFIPIITRPTRVTENSFSLIDNIFINNPSDIHSGIIPLDLSDHYLIFLNCSNFFLTDSRSQTYSIKYRILNEENVNNLFNSVLSTDFSAVLDTIDVDLGINLLEDMLMNLYNVDCPIISKNVSYKDRIKPWIDRETKMCIRTRQRYFIMYKLGKMSRVVYSEYRNMVTTMIRTKRRKYLFDQFEIRKNNVRETWELINNIIKPGRKNVDEVTNMNIDGNILSDPAVISNKMNEYFAEVGCQINGSFGGASGDYMKFMTGSYIDSFFLNPVSEDDIKKHIMSLKNKPSNVNVLPVNILKVLSPILSPILTVLINRSFVTGKFPDCLKVARIAPIFKGGVRELLNNFRPISILPNFSKIYEKSFYTQLISYFESKNILSDRQFGFRAGKSTSQAISSFISCVYDRLDEGNLYFTMFLDFRKAFDCVDHNILLAKLNYYGVRGVPFQWLKSYLTNRRQYTVVRGHSSKYCNIKYGVPQGSILGPLLFLIYINDFPNSSPYFDFNLFADDSTVSCSFSRNKINSVHLEINNNLAQVSKWLNCNRIMLNVEKTKYVIFSYRGNFNLPIVLINEDQIESVDCVKYLGCYLDNNLNFKDHIGFISMKMSKSIGILHKLKDFVPQFILKKIYDILVHPYISYCILVWGGSASYLINNIILLQKRSVRCITNSDYLAHTSKLFCHLNILKFNDLFKYNIGQHMYKSVLFMEYDPFLLNFINSNTNVHGHLTRYTSQITLPRFKCEMSKRSLLYLGCRFWNELNCQLKESNFFEFKRKLKAQLIEEY